jgi:hypothetical protein
MLDEKTGKDFSVRRERIRRRMKALAPVFDIDVLTYAIIEQSHALDPAPSTATLLRDSLQRSNLTKNFRETPYPVRKRGVRDGGMCEIPKPQVVNNHEQDVRFRWLGGE